MPAIQMYDLDDQLGAAPTKEYKLYNGQVTLIYNDTDHEYYMDSEQGRVVIPNVSTIVTTLDKSNVLINWALRLAMQEIEAAAAARQSEDGGILFSTKGMVEVLEKARKAHRVAKNTAADIGKMAHGWLEQYGRKRIAGKSHIGAVSHAYPENSKAASCVRAALGWIEEHNVAPIAVELKLYSIEDNCCGTTDWIGMVDGKLTIIDFKSSNFLYDEHRFQIAEYRKMWEEEHKRKLEQSILLRLGKENGEFEAHVFDKEYDYKADCLAFRGLLDAYSRVQELKQEAKLEKQAAKTSRKKAA